MAVCVRGFLFLIYMKQFLRDWTLVLAIIAGIAGYFIYISIPWLDNTHLVASKALTVTQPALIFSMLFLSFCRVSPSSLKPCRWQAWLLLVQGGIFSLIAVILAAIPKGEVHVVLEGCALCLICPTATAAAVVTRKLGGDMAHVTSYTILVNIMVSLLVPAMVPVIHPDAGAGFVNAFLLILGKVFPLLLLPLVCAFVVQKFLPRLRNFLISYPDLPFYLWAVALTLALTATTRSVVHSTVSIDVQLLLVAASLLCCIFQFWVGKKIGGHYNDAITAGQALGQKNTVFVIWLGYTFFTPVTAVVGGFYSIWHNLYNTWQLRARSEKS